MDKPRIRAAALELEGALDKFVDVPEIGMLDGREIREIIRLGKEGEIEEKYSGTFPWAYGFADGWYANYPEFEAAVARFQIAVTRDADDLAVHDLMVANMTRDITGQD